MTHVLHEGRAQDVGMDPARLDRVRKLAAGWVDRGDTPSLVVMAARRGTIVLHEAYGVRRPEDTSPTLQRDSIFPLSSCTKPITAAAVMCLVEDGMIGLNRPVIDYVPEWDVPGVQWIEEMKVADLLCHTGGLDDGVLEAHIQAAAGRAPKLPPAGPGQHPKVNARIRLAAGAPLSVRPGSAMIYSTNAFIVLGDIVRRVSGQPFWQFAQQRLFERLGMHDSSFVFPAERRDRRVYRTSGMPGTSPPMPDLYTGIDTPEFEELDLGNTGATSTARDLAVFLQMLMNGGVYGEQRVLSGASCRAMTSPQVDHSIPWTVTVVDSQTRKPTQHLIRGGGYGFGLFLYGSNRFTTNGALVSTAGFGHLGYAGAYVWADPESEVVGVFLCVVPRLIRGLPYRNSDLFMDAVHAAILD